MEEKSMKLEKSERTALEKRYDSMQEDYPCGLCLYLDSDAIKKLGLTELPKVGAELSIAGKVKVTSVSESESEYGSNRSLSLQITDLGVE